MAFTVDQVMKSLPKVGDLRHGGFVDYVNAKHLWYRVKFTDGTNASFKLPKYIPATALASPKPAIKPKNELIEAEKKHNPENYRCLGVKCKVLETGKTYANYSECAKDLGCSAGSVRTAARRRKKCMRQYTIIEMGDLED